MSARSLGELLAGFADPGAQAQRRISGITLDSRAVVDGDVFIALRGARGHGLKYAIGAVTRGASAVVYEAPVDPAESAELPVPAICVPDLRRKLGAMAARWFGAPSHGLHVVGVTGTNGKTSTVQLLTHALDSLGARSGSIGTLGAGLVGALVAGERTTPDVIAVHALLAKLRDGGASHVAMEVSSHALDQGRVDAVQFAIVVFTNLTHDHLDYHVDMQCYFDAKSRLFHDFDADCAVINRDDPWGRRLLESGPRAKRVLSLSAAGDEAADLYARQLRMSSAGIGFALFTPWGKLHIASPLLGRFNVDNLLAVAACLGALGFSGPRIEQALGVLEPVSGRMNRFGGDAHAPLLVVDYAHTPDALEQALRSLRAHTSGRLLCVFGCGGERDAGKRPLMGEIAERLSDSIVITDDNPRGENGDAIVAAIVAGLARPHDARIERDREQAIALAVAQARPGDTVLIAGKGHEDYQEVAGVKRAFDDMRCARSALQARA